MMMTRDELKSRIEAKRHQLQARLSELKADTQQAAAHVAADAREELAHVEGRLRELGELLREGWEDVTERISDRLRSWLKTTEAHGNASGIEVTALDGGGDTGSPAAARLGESERSAEGVAGKVPDKVGDPVVDRVGGKVEEEVEARSAAGVKGQGAGEGGGRQSTEGVEGRAQETVADRTQPTTGKVQGSAEDRSQVGGRVEVKGVASGGVRGDGLRDGSGSAQDGSRGRGPSVTT